ncbi:methyltransferase domain-containing protein [Halomonas vilamensis]|uniref:Methyltransferase domain-containing protein n=1 Tax=Vreelandella vilamensis TaxID=531309 RepID=A0ABU1H2U8_9GAMM|nr:methyltransferase domain-containing protein [Halomonas vilamensis]MDR5898176.1 methyltransferase domain-containing protein [Halomonas vilamensis]
MADKFARSLYNAPRGALRLALLDTLLPEMLTLHQQPVLDVGGGLGQQAAWFAQRGHAVILTEPSGDMLARAQDEIDAQAALSGHVRYVKAPLQKLAEVAPGPWPLIVCHAVLEWLGDPHAALVELSRCLAPGGQLSLMVFNRDALRFSNVVKGNMQKALNDELEGLGKGQRLTPISPLTHAQIDQWCEDAGLVIEHVAGIRIFQDYLREPPASKAQHLTLLALEKQYCRVDPHWRFGRYLLYTLIKPSELPPETPL